MLRSACIGLALLLASALQALSASSNSATNAKYTHTLPHHIADPRWAPLPVWQNRTRFWGRPLLDGGIRHLGHLAHFKRFFDKLERGERIVAVAYGSSFIHDFAGCFQTSLGALWDLGIVPNPMLYPQQGGDVRMEDFATTAPRCASGGFIEGVMASINATWPHPGHIFVNNGKGGACLTYIAEASCMSSFTPKQVDLVFLDTITNPCGDMEQSAEKMIRQFMRQPSPPLIAFLSNAHTCVGQGLLGGPCALECLREHHGNRSAAPCQNLPDPYTTEPEKEFEERLVTKAFNPVALRYDIGHISYWGIIKPLMHGGTNEHFKLTKYEFLYRIYKDWVHFNKDDVGTMWAADAILHWLARGQEALMRLTTEERNALTWTMPTATLHPGASTHYTTRCYGITMKAALDYVKHGLVPPLDQLTMSEWNRTNPGDTFEFFQMSVGHNPALALPPFNIMTNKGWELQMYYRTADGWPKLKPGWVTDKPGSVLEFVVDSTFPGIAAPTDKVEALFAFTKSYDHWGIAQFCCVANCTCACVEADAYVGPEGKKTSLVHTVSLAVSQHERCVLKAEVLQRTASDGHRFKLASVVLRVGQKL
ncbi:hypothetical protein HYH03_010805 [Edaphochlamys debaryana]|uniref:Uncharacterized protein n=1 Tax=Edaphochlamys debaryana TaxID=47281 RepID=A0A836BX67_9CHLO|nr:hypothetical protein HYH03_010805 [Edaphochlamys debaryana]|eukprot:KAG2490888.1 hypothetical protein HYH03_010805 [Edaphochlamys debaryana]